MKLAKQLNEKLDEIIEMRMELRRMNEDLDDDVTLTNIQTGEPQTKKEAIELIEGLIQDIYAQINKLSNNGKNVNDIFTNKYYINDFMQDREIVNANKEAPNNSNKKSTKVNAPNNQEYTPEEQAILDMSKLYKDYINEKKKRGEDLI